MGRPEKVLDWNRVEKLLTVGCTGAEIAAHFSMHHDTFYEKVKEEYKTSFTAIQQEKKALGHSIIREKQFDNATDGKGDNTLLMFLGKASLGQRDRDQPVIAPNDENIDAKKDLYIARYEMQKMQKEIDELKSKYIPNSSPNPEKQPTPTDTPSEFFQLSPEAI